MFAHNEKRAYKGVQVVFDTVGGTMQESTFAVEKAG